MTPKEYKQMMAYLTRSGIKDKVKFASDLAKPVDKFEVQQIKLFNRFNRAYPREEMAGGGFITKLFKGVSGLQQGRIEKQLMNKYKSQGMNLLEAINKANPEAEQIVKNRKLKIIQDKLNETNVRTDDYVALIDEEIRLNDPELFKDIRKFEKNNRSDLADKMRALRHPDWAEAKFGENYQDVLQQRQDRAIKQMMDDIDPDIKERTIVDDIDDMNQANIDEFFGRQKNADGGRIGLMSGTTPKVQEMLDLITPVKQKYIDLKQAQIDLPEGGTLKDFPSYEQFLIQEIDSVKNTKDAKKIISSTRYYLDQPEKLSDSKKKLLDKLIEIENKMPGRATPGYKLALQAGYVMKKTTKGSKTTTAPSGSFTNLLTVNDKKINRIDEVIRQLDSGQLTIDDIVKEGSLTRYINKPFGFKDPESFNILIRNNKKYKDRLDEFKLLNNQSFFK